MYRMAAAADFAAEDEESPRALEWLAWLTVYRAGPLTLAQIEQQTRAASQQCREALERLVEQGHVDRTGDGDDATYTSGRFEIPLGQTYGWEAAVLDHFQALVTAVAIKLGDGASSARLGDLVGGSTWTLDVRKDHPLREEAVSTLARLRRELEDLRERIDAHNAREPSSEPGERVVVYVGQYVRDV